MLLLCKLLLLCLVSSSRFIYAFASVAAYARFSVPVMFPVHMLELHFVPFPRFQFYECSVCCSFAMLNLSFLPAWLRTIDLEPHADEFSLVLIMCLLDLGLSTSLCYGCFVMILMRLTSAHFLFHLNFANLALQCAISMSNL